jgi:hypothetical protein
MSKPEDFKFDSRVRERMLRSRGLAARDLERYLEQLPDLEGEYELLNDTPQPAVTPPRDHVEEPLVFDGIRRLQSLSEPHGGLRSAPSATASAPQAPREPLTRSFGNIAEVSRGPSPALRSALMESEISGVGAGAVSAALGAMSPEARSAAGFSATSFPTTVPVVPQPSAAEGEPQTPVTLRSQSAPEHLKEDRPEAESEAEPEGSGGVADWEAPYPDSEDMA